MGQRQGETKPSNGRSKKHTAHNKQATTGMGFSPPSAVGLPLLLLLVRLLLMFDNTSLLLVLLY